MNMLLKGFGYFVFVLCMSFSLKAEDIHGNSEAQETDTSIAVTEIVVATAVSSPSDNENTTAIIMEEENAVPEAIATPKAPAVSQNKYNTLHPLAIAFVRDYEKKHEKRLEKITSKYARQMALIDKIMIRYDLPTELKYLALIESEMFNGAVSRKGAVGPWQFMAPTGRLMGLTINHNRDERRDLTKSTHAAAKYLKILHNQFNDWLLVIAAYNGGASRVDAAIKKSQSRDFWKLQYYLPAESRAHVKKYVAACYILEKQEETAVPLLNMEKLMAENLNDLSILHISGKYNINVIVEALDMEAEAFNLYNPDFEKEVVARGYDMRLPKDKMQRFKEKRQDILNDSIEMLLKSNSTVFSNDKSDYPEAIGLPKTKAIMSTAGEQKMMKRK
ncbi:lytic transglycosylase domain-containing protein [Agriterribacter sp.]|uniref:lytic transglycosylase domain-containing protein n=1 Tax=Agriterribacter sp. TaxID=2821509 RepID=UPI002BFBA2F9|nr:lytic transglycosylase domain-containing protein [Agriterribacter sp.]HRO47823.1 lytic transglycosylase domain-containing protein [Agriterribacter sp.]HRQ15870.1 lytic transglycosylase domain-containing protein [Agriterribacter sp.]